MDPITEGGLSSPSTPSRPSGNFNPLGERFLPSAVQSSRNAEILGLGDTWPIYSGQFIPGLPSTRTFPTDPITPNPIMDFFPTDPT
jgi:hypothetical protein